MNKEVAAYYDNKTKNTVVWSYESEGDFGEQKTKNSEDVNFLRFRCLDENLRPIKDASYLTFLTSKLPKEHLKDLTHYLIMRALKQENYRNHLSTIATFYTDADFTLEGMH